ncbi:MAG: 7-cyano-7-deazaguanine synthase QueC [Desulfatibacillaceae bacterium]
MAEKTVVLLSGGIDSTTAMAAAKAQEYEIYSLTFDYGQRHRAEVEAARSIAESMNVARHVVVELDFSGIRGSALTGDMDVPKNRSGEEISDGIPVTYVPARNTIFLSWALAWAEVIGAADIFIGVNAVDYSGYPDCRPEFIRSFETTARLGTRAGVEGRPFTIRTPLIDMTKAQIIRLGCRLGVDYALTKSCYDPSPEGLACGRCDSCLLRGKGFAEAGVPDPTKYRKD